MTQEPDPLGVQFSEDRLLGLLDLIEEKLVVIL
jgi:hypothetical protein